MNSNTNIYDILSLHFVQNAIFGGILMSICAGLLGYFVILRKMTFASHALSHIGIPGATGAILLGVSPFFGVMCFCFVSGILIAVLGKNNSSREISTGTILAFSLSIGLFFSTLSSKATNQMQSILFGSINLITDDTLLVFGIITLIVIVIFILMYNKLLLSSLNPELALTKGINVKLVNIVFILLLAGVTVMTVQVLGALLPFALLITPAAAAINFSANPKIVFGLSICIGIISTCVGVFLAVLFDLPTSFVIVSIIFAIWLISKFFND